ncbi:tryptophan--tRNA ligase [endosymbiont 'TC1' of Trimyema compressum]|uniref:tryptophan--tRNA ligase n=1 Tax=endosymbiont 'TC1' of Trimyema compressum TaxID=243899 RepID=UPI0007F162A1|nr:tryptophan--tRNA ligase [endosymbiont 'TC1' of Trimyema compressum]AMP20560.1 tryptophan--tRNA ligase [endosymbiont 'TC1' of Trimyema compressum]
MKETILSGMRPTGTLHIGHLSVLNNWVSLQAEYKCYFFAADYHALTTGYENTADLQENIKNMVIDWMAVGIDPEKSTLFVQSKVQAHAEIFLLLSMLTPLSWLERCPTYKAQIEQFKVNQGKDITTYGFLGYPVLQAGDILLYNANRVPVGKDQLPHVEMTREIARRFNHIYNKKIFVEPEGKLSEIPLIVGTDGRKMSKSYHNQINIMSDEKELNKKVRSMITDPSRIHKTDPGNPDVCTVFNYQKIYNAPIIEKLESNCRKGTIGCMDCKKKLISALDILLSPFREKRAEILKKPSYVEDVLREGQIQASKQADETLNAVKSVMNMA